MGVSAPKEDLDNMIKEIDGNGSGTIEAYELIDYIERTSVLNFRFDGDGNGQLDGDEFQRLINNMGVSAPKEDLDNMIKEIDGNGSGTIEAYELIDYIERTSVLNFSGDEIMEAFNLIDHDSGGEITLEELTKALQSADVGISSRQEWRWKHNIY
eukprot:sb/3473214/